MTKKILLLFLTLMSILIYTQVEATISVTPLSLRIPRGLPTTTTIAYSITNDSGCTQAISSRGEFISGQYLLGVVNTTVSASLTPTGGGPAPATSGTTTERLLIPIKVIKRAESLNINRFEYRRRFDFSGCTVGVPSSEFSSLWINVTSEAAAPFRITRLQLYFENRRAEITVKRNQKKLRAYVDIRYAGSGLLQGYWEADGRIIENVNRHLVYGRSITIESPEVPSFPTFDTGTHRVRFVITNPSREISLPEAIYFVTTEEAKEALYITLLSPKDRSEIDYSPLIFKWEGRDRTITYLVEFGEDGREKPIFSAYTNKVCYRLPSSVLKNIFVPGKVYQWRIKGFDSENNVVGESPTFSFTFKELASYLLG